MKLQDLTHKCLIILTGNETCLVTGVAYEVFETVDHEFFVSCRHGIHWLRDKDLERAMFASRPEAPAVLNLDSMSSG
jgi:hypothetical protein